MKKIALIYYSKTGNTKAMAGLVREGAQQAGDVEVTPYKAGQFDVDEVFDADGFAFGSPDYFTYMAGQLKTFFDETLAHRDQLKDRPCVSFVSHGGGGGAIDSIDRLAQAVGLRPVAEGVRCKGAPDEIAADQCRFLGKALAEAVLAQGD